MFPRIHSPHLLLALLTIGPKLGRACTWIEAWGSWLHRVLLCWDNICGTPLKGVGEEKREKKRDEKSYKHHTSDYEVG